MKAALQKIMGEFVRRPGQAAPAACDIAADSCWTLRIGCDLPQLPGLCVRSLENTDVPRLVAFGARLGPVSKDLFGPYPWHDVLALSSAFRNAVQNAIERVDASYMIETPRDGAIGHFFLWKAGGNPHSQEYQLEVPELGVAIADAFQGKGLGSLSVRILQAVARELRADAIELTTAFSNEAGWRTYRRCGFEYCGDINIPLGVDVTAPLANGIAPVAYRLERQMVYLINDEKRERVLSYLAAKRKDSRQRTA